MDKPAGPQADMAMSAVAMPPAMPPMSQAMSLPMVPAKRPHEDTDFDQANREPRRLQWTLLNSQQIISNGMDSKTCERLAMRKACMAVAQDCKGIAGPFDRTTPAGRATVYYGSCRIHPNCKYRFMGERLQGTDQFDLYGSGEHLEDGMAGMGMPIDGSAELMRLNQQAIGGGGDDAHGWAPAARMTTRAPRGATRAPRQSPAALRARAAALEALASIAEQEEKRAEATAEQVPGSSGGDQIVAVTPQPLPPLQPAALPPASLQMAALEVPQVGAMREAGRLQWSLLNSVQVVAQDGVKMGSLERLAMRRACLNVGQDCKAIAGPFERGGGRTVFYASCRLHRACKFRYMAERLPGTDQLDVYGTGIHTDEPMGEGMRAPRTNPLRTATALQMGGAFDPLGGQRSAEARALAAAMRELGALSSAVPLEGDAQAAQLRAAEMRAAELQAAQQRAAAKLAAQQQASERQLAELRAAELKAAELQAAMAAQRRTADSAAHAVQQQVAAMTGAELQAVQQQVAEIQAAERAAQQQQQQAVQQQVADLQASELTAEQRQVVQQQVAEFQAAELVAQQRQAQLRQHVQAVEQAIQQQQAAGLAAQQQRQQAADVQATELIAELHAQQQQQRQELVSQRQQQQQQQLQATELAVQQQRQQVAEVQADQQQRQRQAAESGQVAVTSLEQTFAESQEQLAENAEIQEQMEALAQNDPELFQAAQMQAAQMQAAELASVEQQMAQAGQQLNEAAAAMAAEPSGAQQLQEFNQADANLIQQITPEVLSQLAQQQGVLPKGIAEMVQEQVKQLEQSGSDLQAVGTELRAAAPGQGSEGNFAGDGSQSFGV